MFHTFCLHRIHSFTPCIMIMYTRTPRQLSSIQSIQGRCFSRFAEFFQHFVRLCRQISWKAHKKSDGNKGRAYFWKTVLYNFFLLAFTFCAFYDFLCVFMISAVLWENTSFWPSVHQPIYSFKVREQSKINCVDLIYNPIKFCHYS